MENKKTIFDTPPINRLMQEILNYTQEWSVRVSEKRPMFLLTFTEDERKQITEKTVHDLVLFKTYLEENGIIKVLKNSEELFKKEFSSTPKIPETPYSRYFFEKQMDLKEKKMLPFAFTDWEKFNHYIWAIIINDSKKITELCEILKNAKEDEQIKPTQRNHAPKKVKLFRGDLKPEITIGKLVAYNDGSIKFGGEEIIMRNQIKDLCRLFMEKPNQLLTYDDIKDHLIHADRRSTVSFTTISKYVSELRNSLKKRFEKNVITNQKEEGWFFKP